MSRAPTLAPSPAPVFAFAAVDSIVRYLEVDLQRILKAVFEAGLSTPAPISQPLIFLNSPWDRPLKTRFSELYCNKTHRKCYKFIQQCEDHFATAKAKEQNRVPFAATFFQKQTLFHWQQHKAKTAGKTNVPLT